MPRCVCKTIQWVVGKKHHNFHLFETRKAGQDGGREGKGTSSEKTKERENHLFFWRFGEYLILFSSTISKCLLFNPLKFILT